MEAILEFDIAFFRFVEEHLWSPALDAVMVAVTTLGDGGLIWIALGAVLLFFKNYRRFGIMIFVALLFSLIINDNILKPLIARPRPFDLESWKTIFVYPELIERPSSLSFPSGHSSSSLAAAVVLLFSKNKKLGIPVLVFALLMAFSRIYVHVHYATDVFAGIVAGTVYALLAVLLVSRLEPLIKAKIATAREKKKPGV